VTADEPSDETLLQAWVAGDANAGDRAVRRFFPLLWRYTALTPSGDASWSLELDLPPSVLLRHADIDAEGTLVVCGDRLTAEAPTQSSPVLVSVAVP
jgi:hypothetical protein